MTDETTAPAASLDDLRAQRDELDAVIAQAEADELPASWCEVCNMDHGDEPHFIWQAPNAPRASDERDAQDDEVLALDAMIDALGEATQRALGELAERQTAKLIEARDVLLVRATSARIAWEAVQHGKRGERWAAAQARAIEARLAFQTLDALI